MRRNTSQTIVVTRSQKALSRYQVSDFCECKRLETRLREEDKRVFKLLYDSESVDNAAVDCSFAAE